MELKVCSTAEEIAEFHNKWNKIILKQQFQDKTGEILMNLENCNEGET